MTDTIIHGDCVKVMPRYAGQVDLIVTSPPYDNMREYAGQSDFDFEATATACYEALREGGVLCWNVADQQVDGDYTLTSFRQALHFVDIGFRCRERLIYQRAQRMPRGTKNYQRDTEFVFVLTKGKGITFNPIKDTLNITRGKPAHKGPSGRVNDQSRKHTRSTDTIITSDYGKRGEVWRYAAGLHHTAPDDPNAHDHHPAMMPLKLAQDLIRSYSNEGDLVLDPFSGSGTTLVAAKYLLRDSVGIDINKDYCDYARTRLAQEVLG